MSKLKVLAIALIGPLWLLFLVGSLFSLYDLIFVPSSEWNGYQVAGFPSTIIFLLINLLLLVRYLIKRRTKSLI